MKRLSIAAGLLLVLCLLPARAGAQTGTARGKVADEQGQPLAEVKILLEYQGGVSRTLETKSNKKGEFTQVGLTSGMYKITASKEGYQSSMLTTRISLGDPTYLPDFKLVSAKAAAAAAGAGPEKELQEGFARALEQTQAGRFDEAEATYKALLAKAPSIPELQYNLGYVHSQKQDWPAAEAAFLKALELKPGYSEATVALAKVYQEMNQPDKALELMSKAGEGADGKVLYNLGIFHLNAGRSEEAMQAFLKAEAADPENPEVQYHLGTLFVGQNKIPEAVAHLEKYLAMKPSNAQNVATAQGLLQALKPRQ